MGEAARAVRVMPQQEDRGRGESTEGGMRCCKHDQSHSHWWVCFTREGVVYEFIPECWPKDAIVMHAQAVRGVGGS